MGLPLEEVNGDATVDDFIVRQQELAESAYHVAREQLQVAAQWRKRAYDVRVRPEEFGVGNWVWYRYPRRYIGRSPKWQKSYRPTGPFLAVCEIPPVNYVLQRSARSKTFVIHKDKLKKCYSPPAVCELASSCWNRRWRGRSREWCRERSCRGSGAITSFEA